MNGMKSDNSLSLVSMSLAGETLPPATKIPAIPVLCAVPRELAEIMKHLENGEVRPCHVSRAKLPAVGGYEIECELGRGGMAIVYKAWQRRVGRMVALKMFRDGARIAPSERSRFWTEVEAIAELQHPNVIQIHDAGEDEGRPFFCMELLEGGTLSQRLACAPLPPEESAKTLEIVARAVHFAHERGIVHRDLKPGNILLAVDGTPKVADFGLAKYVRSEVGETKTGDILGTPLYMAPEQVLGSSSPSVDIYALGAILYELLTGRPPFRGTTALETLQQVATQDPVPITRLRPRVPADLQTICLKCLEKEPARRYQTAANLADDLRRFLEGKPILARRVSALERGRKLVSRQPLVAGLMSILIVCGLGLLIGLVWEYGKLRSATLNQQEQAHAISIQRQIVETKATEVALHQHLAEKNLETARLTARRAMQVARVLSRHPDTTKLQFDLLEDALKVYEQLPPGNDREVKHEAARTYMTLAYAIGRQGRVNRAQKLFQEATWRLEELVEDYPQEYIYEYDLASLYGRQAHVLFVQNSTSQADAEQMLNKSCTMLEKLGSEYPDKHTHETELALHRKWLKEIQQLADPSATTTQLASVPL